MSIPPLPPARGLGKRCKLPQWSPERNPGGKVAIFNVLYAYKVAPGVNFADIIFQNCYPARGHGPSGHGTYATARLVSKIQNVN